MKNLVVLKWCLIKFVGLYEIRLNYSIQEFKLIDADFSELNEHSFDVLKNSTSRETWLLVCIKYSCLSFWKLTLFVLYMLLNSVFFISWNFKKTFVQFCFKFFNIEEVNRPFCNREKPQGIRRIAICPKNALLLKINRFLDFQETIENV